MKILLEICTKAAIICLKKQNFKLKEISKNPRKKHSKLKEKLSKFKEKTQFLSDVKKMSKKDLGGL